MDRIGYIQHSILDRLLSRFNGEVVIDEQWYPEFLTLRGSKRSLRRLRSRQLVRVYIPRINGERVPPARISVTDSGRQAYSDSVLATMEKQS